MATVAFFPDPPGVSEMTSSASFMDIDASISASLGPSKASVVVEGGVQVEGVEDNCEVVLSGGASRCWCCTYLP